MQNNMEQDEERKVSGCDKKYMNMEYKKTCPYMKQPMTHYCPMMQSPMMQSPYQWDMDESGSEEREDEENFADGEDDSRIVRPYHHYFPYYFPFYFPYAPYPYYHHYYHHRPHYYPMMHRDAEDEEGSGEEEEYRPVHFGGHGHFGHYYHPYHHRPHYNYYPYFPSYPYYEDYYDGYSD